jgi:hypothetical protein
MPGCCRLSGHRDAASTKPAANFQNGRMDIKSAVLNSPGFDDGEMGLTADGVAVSFNISCRVWASCQTESRVLELLMRIH